MFSSSLLWWFGVESIKTRQKIGMVKTSTARMEPKWSKNCRRPKKVQPGSAPQGGLIGASSERFDDSPVRNIRMPRGDVSGKKVHL
jgi:hypothetical protein